MGSGGRSRGGFREGKKLDLRAGKVLDLPREGEKELAALVAARALRARIREDLAELDWLEALVDPEDVATHAVFKEYRTSLELGRKGAEQLLGLALLRSCKQVVEKHDEALGRIAGQLGIGKDPAPSKEEPLPSTPPTSDVPKDCAYPAEDPAAQAKELVRQAEQDAADREGKQHYEVCDDPTACEQDGLGHDLDEAPARFTE